MKRRDHILTEYRSILDHQHLPRAAAEIARIDAELAAVHTDTDDAILSSLIQQLGGPETHGSGGRSTDGVAQGFGAYCRGLAEVASLRKSLQAERAELTQDVRRMEKTVHAVETWMQIAGPRYIGDLTVTQAVDRYWREQTNETIALAAGYQDESIIRHWFESIDRQIRGLMNFTIQRARKNAPKTHRNSTEKRCQFVLVL